MSWEKVAQKLILQVVESLDFPCFIAPKLPKLPKMQVALYSQNQSGKRFQTIFSQLYAFKSRKALYKVFASKQ